VTTRTVNIFELVTYQLCYSLSVHVVVFHGCCFVHFITKHFNIVRERLMYWCYVALGNFNERHPVVLLIVQKLKQYLLEHN
jgi:hypothetical protein